MKNLVFLLSLCLVLSACGGGGSGGSGGSGSGSSAASKTVAGVLYEAEEDNPTTHGYIKAQYAYTDGTVGTATTVVASYCSGNNDHDLITNTTVNPGTTYLYLICRNSGTIMGWKAESSPSTTLTQVAALGTGACCLAQLALSSNGKYLFVANNATNTLLEYSVGSNGSLTSMSGLSISSTKAVYSVAVSPSGNYLVLARADTAGTTYYLDEYAVDNSTGGLSQVGTDVTISTLNTSGGLYPAPNTNNGDILSYVTGQGGNQILIIKAGSSWTSSDIVSLSLAGGSASYGGPQFNTTGKVLYLSGVNTGGCSFSAGYEVLAYSVGTGGSSITQTASSCGLGAITSEGDPAALDSTDGLYFTDESVWSVSSSKVSYVGLTAALSYGTVFVP